MLVGLAFLLLILWTVRSRHIVALSFCFLLVSFVWRVLAGIYVDWAGAVYAPEIERTIFSASAANAYALSALLTVCAYIFVLRTRAFSDALQDWRTDPPREQVNFDLGNVVFLGMSCFVIGMYIDLLVRGPIPIFACMERYAYSRDHGGPLHQAYFKYGPLLALQLGTFTVYPRLQGRPYRWRFLAIAGALFCYSLITGERYSAFYKLMCFYAMPFAAVLVLAQLGKLPQAQGGGRVARLMGKPSTWLGLAAVSGLAIVLAIGNSYINVRSDRGQCAVQSRIEAAVAPTTSAVALGAHESGKFDPTGVGAKLRQRVLVQPIQMWFVTWNRVVIDGDWRPDLAAEFMFDIPTAFDGNKGVRFLMHREMGQRRATELKSQGNQVAGGYPEVLFELAGPWLAWPLLLAIALLTAWLVRRWLVSLIHGHLITAFFATYVFYAFMVLYIGGMTNFVVAYTFWAKVILFLFFWRMEPHLVVEGRRLVQRLSSQLRLPAFKGATRHE